MSSKEAPLFVPLKRQYFDAFKSGEKTTEYRIYGPRWNDRTCRVGREVTLSMGYGKKHRLQGWVTSFDTTLHPDTIPGFVECYGSKAFLHVAACIGITLTESLTPPSQTKET